MRRFLDSYRSYFLWVIHPFRGHRYQKELRDGNLDATIPFDSFRMLNLREFILYSWPLKILSTIAVRLLSSKVYPSQEWAQTFHKTFNSDDINIDKLVQYIAYFDMAIIPLVILIAYFVFYLDVKIWAKFLGHGYTDENVKDVALSLIPLFVIYTSVVVSFGHLGDNYSHVFEILFFPAHCIILYAGFTGPLNLSPSNAIISIIFGMPLINLLLS